MEPERERPWRANAPNELIVNSILAAISTIVVQTIVTSEHPRYWTGWLATAVASILLFVISTEQLGEAIREYNLTAYIRSLNFYNVGVLLLFLSVCAILNRYTDLSVAWSILVFAIATLLWAWFWGCDALFLICRSEHYDRWKRKIDGETVDGEILDHCDVFLASIKRRWRTRP